MVHAMAQRNSTSSPISPLRSPIQVSATVGKRPGRHDLPYDIGQERSGRHHEVLPPAVLDLGLVASYKGTSDTSVSSDATDETPLGAGNDVYPERRVKLDLQRFVALLDAWDDVVGPELPASGVQAADSPHTVLQGAR